MAFQRENQRLSATDVLQALADGEDIKLNACTITGRVDLNRLLEEEAGINCGNLKVEQDGEKSVIKLSQPLTFNNCKFESDVFFAPPWEEPEAVRVVFEKEVLFNSSQFLGQSRFTNGTFQSYAGFDGCTFEHVCCFRDTEYYGQAMFRTVAFNGYGLFTGAMFHNEARFTNSYFGKGGNFTNVTFEDRTDFAGVYSKSKSVPVYESVKFARSKYGDDETFWRFIKQASQEAGYYQLAGESFYEERCAHLCRKFRGVNYDRLSPGKKLLRILAGIRLLPELVFGKMLFGYGERPIRVLFASAAIIVICALFYCSGHSHLVYRADDGYIQPQTFMDGLYFSTITFTTLGFGDIYPERQHLLTRAVAMTEALAGACLMALFVVTLSKRYSRG